jgi:organic radical activating enzyme
MNSSRNVTSGTNTMLNLNSDTVEKVMNSDYFKETRLQMLAGVAPIACMRCFTEEQAGVRSKRAVENERLGFTEDMAMAMTNADGSIPVNFKFVELRLGNLCNVKCRPCNPASSTQWAPEYKKLQQELKFVTHYETKINCSWTESDAFWDDLLEHSKDVELLYVNGGEPTLVEKHWHYLERLIERGLNKQITLWYNINMTNLPDRLLDLWKQFKAVQVSCSIDDLAERNDYIRTGTKWDAVISNLDKLQSMPWINTSVCQTISWMNVFYLPEFHEFMKRRGLHVHMNFVHDPAYLSVAILPQSLKTAIANKCGALESWQMTALQQQFSLPSNARALQHGMTYNSWLDMSRHTNFESTFVEWNSLLREIL